MNPAYLVPLLFPIVFGGIWLLVVTIVGWASGWRRLEQEFPDREDAVVATYRGASAIMGGNTQLNNVLTVTACRGGMRVALSPFFGPGRKPFFVPWAQITVGRRRLLFETLAVLELGSPPRGKMQIRLKLADKLAAAAQGRWLERPSGRP